MDSTYKRDITETHLLYTLDGKLRPGELYDFVLEYAEAHGLEQTVNALPFGREKHSGQYRLGDGHLDYFYHPLSAAALAIALGMDRDEIVAAALLHDVCEDCGVRPEELPVNASVREAVSALTRDPETGWTEPGKEQYYGKLKTEKIALPVKLLDRCNNVSTMYTGFKKTRIMAYTEDTLRWVYPLFEPAERYWPEYRLQLYMIRQQMDSILGTIRYLTEPSK